jgi:hypothetical protein
MDPKYNTDGVSRLQIGDDLNPIRVLALFSAITEETCELLDLAGRPEHLIMTHLPVPPVCIRPSVEMEAGGGSNEDDITMKLMVRRPSAGPAPPAVPFGHAQNAVAQSQKHAFCKAAVYVIVRGVGGARQLMGWQQRSTSNVLGGPSAQNIIDTNNGLREALQLGFSADKVMDSWDFLQVNCAMYINSDVPGLSQANQPNTKPLRCGH